jgi:hypothetical protein
MAMAGSHNATTPYHYHSKSKRGWAQAQGVVGFWVGFSLGTCCRIWLGHLIPFILIPDPLHTYKKCLAYFLCGGQSYEGGISLSGRFGVWRRGKSGHFWHVSYWYVLIGFSHPLQTHTRFTSYIYNALDILYMRWAVYECVLTPPPLHPIALAKFGIW